MGYWCFALSYHRHHHHRHHLHHHHHHMMDVEKDVVMGGVDVVKSIAIVA